MTVALFYGEVDVGKTTMCRRLHDLFCSIPGATSEFHRLNGNDFKSKITLHNCSISVYSAGDDQETLEESVDWANHCACDYHIGSVRKNIKYQKHLSKFNTDNKIIWINL